MLQLHYLIPWIRAHITLESDAGASLVEYALLVGLIAVVCIVGVTALGQKASSDFNSVQSSL